jgi:hypothetical protein
MITVSFENEDWVWLCEVLSEIRDYPEAALISEDDRARAESALEAAVAGV